MIYELKACDTTEETIREPLNEDRQLSDSVDAKTLAIKFEDW